MYSEFSVANTAKHLKYVNLDNFRKYFRPHRLHAMLPVATDVIHNLVCVLGKWVSYAKTAESVKMPFGRLTHVGPRKHITCGHCSVFLWRQYDTLCTWVFVDNFTFPYNGCNRPEWKTTCVSSSLPAGSTSRTSKFFWWRLL